MSTGNLVLSEGPSLMFYFQIDRNKLTVTMSYPEGSTLDKPTVQRPRSLTDLTESADDVYEFCGENSPPVLPKKQQQQRGPPPKPPTPYRVSHTIERRVPTVPPGIYQRKVSAESTSSMESWQENSTSPPPQPFTAIKQRVYTTTSAPHSDPITRKNKQKLFTKLRNKLPSAT